MRALYVILPLLCILAIAYRYYSAFIAARMSVVRGRPPAFAGGINGPSRAHSASVRSLGNPAPSRR